MRNRSLELRDYVLQDLWQQETHRVLF